MFMGHKKQFALSELIPIDLSLWAVVGQGATGVWHYIVFLCLILDFKTS